MFVERKELCDLLEMVTQQSIDDVIFSHPAAGPLDPVRTLQLAIAHFDWMNPSRGSIRSASAMSEEFLKTSVARV